jgi:outer membrane lipoprotein SlyB
MKTRLIVLTPLIFLAACAVTDQAPVVDMYRVDSAQYETELAQCQEYANQFDAKQEVVLRSVIGFVAGAAIGSIFGNADVIESFAGAGAVSGATQGSVNSIDSRNGIIRNCLRNRGYQILG